jgi:hypothetical protein
VAVTVASTPRVNSDETTDGDPKGLVPLDAAAGQLALMQCFTRAASATVGTAPSGWIGIGVLNSDAGRTGTSAGTTFWFVKELTTGDLSATHTLLTSTASVTTATIITFTGFDPAAPLNAYDIAYNSTSDTTGETPPITTTVDNCLILHSIASVGTYTSAAWASPLTSTPLWAYNTATNTRNVLGQIELQATAGLTSQRVVTRTGLSSPSSGAQIAIAPEVVIDPGPPAAPTGLTGVVLT